MTNSATAYKQPFSVLVVIYTLAGDVLLLERARHPGFWQSVTGSREGSESALATACREVGEETGLNYPPAALQDWHIENSFSLHPAWRHRYAPEVRHNTEQVFALALPERLPIRIAPAEHRASVWLPWREAAERCFSWSNRDAILLLEKQLAPQRTQST
ncbi:dihydroneopterin triphosphate diphosphatase [Azonexus sp.]|uniref:dihydroneopterin triphosphate diphosphatase n=1 Tax=Azonexus sp. TaxID=1872668 RepID=UPI0039E57F7A